MSTHSTEIEQCVLGSILLEPGCVNQVIAQKVTPEHFHDIRNRYLYETAIGMVEAGEPVDMVALAVKLGKNAELCGGITYISSLPDKVPSSANLPTYIKGLKAAQYRRIIKAKAQELIKKADEAGDDLEKMVTDVEAEVFSMRPTAGGESGDRKSSMHRVVNMLEEALANRGKLPGLSTGYSDLDRILGGLRPGKMIVVAARPGVGKTTLAMNIGENVSSTGTPVAAFSFEMEEDELNAKALAAESGVDIEEALRGNICEGDVPKLVHAAGRLSKRNLYIRDESDMTIQQLRAEGRRLAQSKKIKLIVVDYLQLVNGSNKRNRVDEVGEVSRELKKMAKELHVPVIALAQLNRDIEKDAGRRPRLADLRESGSIEQDADTVIFIYNPDPANEGLLDLPVKLCVAKNRGGRLGEIDMLFKKTVSKFVQMAKFNDVPA
jgi:replicative DNA helicase